MGEECGVEASVEDEARSGDGAAGAVYSDALKRWQI